MIFIFEDKYFSQKFQSPIGINLLFQIWLLSDYLLKFQWIWYLHQLLKEFLGFDYDPYLVNMIYYFHMHICLLTLIKIVNANFLQLFYIFFLINPLFKQNAHSNYLILFPVNLKKFIIKKGWWILIIFILFYFYMIHLLHRSRHFHLRLTEDYVWLHNWSFLMVF